MRLCLRECQRRRGGGLFYRGWARGRRRGGGSDANRICNSIFYLCAKPGRCRTLNTFRRGWAHLKLARSLVALGMALSCIAGDGMHADSIRPRAVMVFSWRSGLRSHQMASYQRNNSYFVKGRGVHAHLGVPPPLSSSVFFLSSL